MVILAADKPARPAGAEGYSAGKEGRIILNVQGQLVFEKNPTKRIIFFGCSISPESILGRTYTTKDEIRRWAKMCRST